jgi:hypothetical protein
LVGNTRFMTSLGRTAKHLPNITLDDPLNRITIDARGRVWVTEDTMLVILKGHLLIEVELNRFFKNPAALERVRFSERLKRVRALLDEDAVPEEGVWSAIEHLNRIRNMLAHNLEPESIEKELCQFFSRFDEFEAFAASFRDDTPTPERLTGCVLFLCGALSSIENPD